MANRRRQYSAGAGGIRHRLCSASRPHRRIAEKVGLPAHAENTAEMSGGMQQRLQIARCLRKEPKALLMDEHSAPGCDDAAGLQTRCCRWSKQQSHGDLRHHDLEESDLSGRRVIGLLPHPAASASSSRSICRDRAIS